MTKLKNKQIEKFIATVFLLKGKRMTSSSPVSDWFILSLQLTSTINSNLEASLVTHCHPVTETFKFLVSLISEKYNREQRNRQILYLPHGATHSSYHLNHCNNFPQHTCSPDKQLCYLWGRQPQIPPWLLMFCIQAWEGYSPRFLQERCVINMKAVSPRKQNPT